MRTLVTGASGFVGTNLCPYLAGKGHEVTAIARKPKSLEALKSANVRIAAGDIRNSTDLERTLPGHEAVINLAAFFNKPEASWEDYRAVNVTGIKNILEISKRSGVNRVIHCSTVGVAAGPGKPPYDESTPYAAPTWDKYETTKMEGEQAALAFGRQEGYPVVVIRPAQIYGPGDTSKLKFFKMIRKGTIVNPGSTLKHPIYVGDLCRAFELALTNEKAPGEVVIIGCAEAVRLREMVAHVAEALGVSRPKVVIPVLPMLAMCVVAEKVFGLFGRRAPIHRRSMDFFTKSVAFRTEKARELLGFCAETPLKEGIRRTAAWYREKGML